MAQNSRPITRHTPSAKVAFVETTSSATAGKKSRGFRCCNRPLLVQPTASLKTGALVV